MIEDWGNSFDDDELQRRPRKKRAAEIGIVKEKLLDFYHLGDEIDMLHEEYKQVMERACSIPSPSFESMPKSTDRTSRTERNAITLVTIQEEIDERIRYEDELRRELDHYIRKIKKPKERQLLRLRYLDRIEWGDLARILYGRERDYKRATDAYQNKAYKTHGAALASLTVIVSEEWPEFLDESRDLERIYHEKKEKKEKAAEKKEGAPSSGSCQGTVTD